MVLKGKDANLNDEAGETSDESVYDSGVEEYDSDAQENDSESDDGNSEQGDFEEQGSSDEEDDVLDKQIKDAKAEDEGDSEDELEILEDFEAAPRNWVKPKSSKRDKDGKLVILDKPENPPVAQWMHTDDLSSDDEDAEGEANRIGAVPLHWYDEHDHIGYDAHGKKVGKSTGGGDLIDQALQNERDIEQKRFMVHDALNDKAIQLSARQLELIRRVQGGAFAHPEHNANPDYIAYFSGVDKEISGINSDKYEPKARFQPSKFEKMHVRRMLHKLKTGDISMDYLTGKVRDMNDVKRKEKIEGEDDKPFMVWKGDEEDELHLRKGPQHIAAPKLPPPGHAESYNPPDEYLPTEEEKKGWEEMDVKERPHGLLVPKKFPNLRSVGAYEHAVRERFERCLDLYLCPRLMKRRLNIDPESLVPSLPKASDLRPFPTSKCIEFETPYKEGEDAPIIRCLSTSPDGQFLASGASDGYVRLWEVQTGRLLQSWNIFKYSKAGSSSSTASGDGDESIEAKPVVSLKWNPNPSHHCLIAAVSNCAVIIATGTGGPGDAALTSALLSAAESCNKGTDNVKNTKAAKAVQWKAVPNDSSGNPISAFGEKCNPIVALHMTHELLNVKWHRKGDYFVTVSPKAGAAAVLIHQLSKANSQQPFGKTVKGGDVQCACFHPSKPFLFVATKQNIRIYHLVKQTMVKREYEKKFLFI